MSQARSVALHVAMVSETFSPFVGGVAAQIEACAIALQKLNVRVSVVTKEQPNSTAYEVLHGIQVYRIPYRGKRGIASSRFSVGAIQRLVQLRPDVLHAHELLLPTTVAFMAKQLLRVPLLVTLHACGPAIGEVARLQRATLGSTRMALLRNNVDAFISISRLIDADLQSAAIPDAKRWAIPNGIDMQRFAPVDAPQKQAIRQKLGIADLPTVIYTGRLSSEKRVGSLLDLWPAIHQCEPTAQLLLVGNGPQASQLRSQGGAGVHFIGDQNDVAPWLQAADIFVMPSVSEGFSVSTLEALAVGLPCVATAVGAIPDYIRHGESGLIVQPDDREALQAGIIELLTNHTLRQQIASKAREGVEYNYSIRQVAGKLNDLYRQLCSASRTK